MLPLPLHLALMCGVFAFLAQTWAVQRTSANRASLLLGTEPVRAVVFRTALGGERLSAVTASGPRSWSSARTGGQSGERARRVGNGPKDPRCPKKETSWPTTAPTNV
ncbi:MULTISPECIES: DMT family transporter [unclassified Streptomyces]|uniref:DMT family transporter n=1 Tax=unclassified Streptomyces TaxID=2593676 RepID=UPI003808CA26